MTKQELIAHLQEQKKIIEREIVFWQTQPDAEAEKPKLRHGDFGIEVVEGTSYQRLITNPANETGLNISNEYGEIPPGHKITTVFGNIFDLLKGKDLTHFKLDVHHYSVNTVDFPHAPIHIAGNWHTEAEAYKFWCDFGQMLMTHKKKQSLT